MCASVCTMFSRIFSICHHQHISTSSIGLIQKFCAIHRTFPADRMMATKITAWWERNIKCLHSLFAFLSFYCGLLQRIRKIIPILYDIKIIDSIILLFLDRYPSNPICAMTPIVVYLRPSSVFTDVVICEMLSDLSATTRNTVTNYGQKQW